MIRLRNKPEEYEQTGSRAGAVKKVWCERQGKGIMANDTAGVPRNGGRAWAGHSVDRGSWWVAQEQSEQMRWAGNGDLQLLADSPGEWPDENAGWGRRNHSSELSQNDGAAHAAGSDG
jgi:hypothetical protein